MDLGTFLGAVVSSLGLGAAAAVAFAQRWGVKWLDARFDQGLFRAKAEIEASLRRQVEDELGESAAERQYRFDARKRLYEAVGPLRFQLVLACAEFSRRIEGIGSGEQRYALAIGGYFGRGTAFRLLRVFALTELIERQVAYADFSADPSIARLLKFKHAAFRCLTSQRISLKHPGENWNDQVEHVFYDVLATISSALIVSEGSTHRVMRPAEFTELVSSRKGLAVIEPIPSFMDAFEFGKKPILWLRLVSLAALCNALVRQEGPRLGIVSDPLNSPELLAAGGGRYIRQHIDRYSQMLDDLSAELEAEELIPE